MAAFLADIEYDRDGNSKTPTSFEIQSLRNNLREIADAAELSEQLENVEIATYTEDTASTPSLYLGETATSSSNASVATTPLGFLQAALPHIDADQLDKALDNAQKADGEMDMWDVIANILTAESIREMEERGLEGLDDYESPVQEHAWATVTGKGSKSAGKKKKRTPTIAIADIRQQHHIRPQPVRRYTTEPVGPAPDAWTQLASLSTHVASFVPSQESSFFLSHFHSPRYSSPYAALCTALAVIRDSMTYTPDEHIPRYLELLNIILPMYEHLNSEEQSRMVAEAELCIIVTRGMDDNALELVSLLRELDSDCALGYLDMGIYHSPQPSPSTLKSFVSRLPAHPPPIPPPPPFKSRQNTNTGSGNKPSPYQWQAVRKRRGPDRPPPITTIHVPAYTRDVNGMKVKGSGNGHGKGGKGDVGELEMYRRRMKESLRKRDEMLREATRSWQKGTSKSHGGEVALFFAERVCPYFGFLFPNVNINSIILLSGAAVSGDGKERWA